jgi:hypothetical protein
VSRVRNADQFLTEFRCRRQIYEQYYVQMSVRVRRKYTGLPISADERAALLKAEEDALLEAHARVFMINSLLGALDWRMDVPVEEDVANLVPEVPLASVDHKTTRFLDYLGLEHSDGRPLLIAESKRPSCKLPALYAPPKARRSFPGEDSIADSERVIADVIAGGLAGQSISSEWNEWLVTLRDYVRSVKQQSGHTPKRVVITNGNWLILFRDPANAFLANGSCDPTNILVYKNRDSIERRFTELFCELEHQSLLSERPALTLGELPFHVVPGTIDLAMHGLRLLYIEEPGFFEPAPVIKVMPIVFLRTRYGAWLCVESRREERLPHASEELRTHLESVRDVSMAFLGEINQRLGSHLPVSSLTRHYSDEESFDPLHGVTECGHRSASGAREFLVLTGDHTHYLIPEPTVPDCPYHLWANSYAVGVASNSGPLETRKTTPKSFFKSGEQHHCTHREVALAKSSRITASNRARCGPRSGQDGQAFCEIGRFEEHLCCRTCAFEEVCTKAQVFLLPCQRSKND